MKTATVTAKGQITIPVEVRRKLKLHPGSRVAFEVRTDSAILTSSSPGILRYAGSVHAAANVEVAGTWKAEERAAHQAACRKERGV
jgi:AbrB family looped-hinge helix DNA binding protein